MSARPAQLGFRPAQRADVPLVLRFIKELAEFERLAHKVVATEAMIEESLFGATPRAEVVFACWDGEPVGFALFFHNFSTFVGRPGLYLEDLYVRPEQRGRQIGRSLMAYLANLAVQRNCGRFEWAVLDWNLDAIRFYRSIGAEGVDDWTIQRLSGDSLAKLAAER